MNAIGIIGKRATNGEDDDDVDEEYDGYEIKEGNLLKDGLMIANGQQFEVAHLDGQGRVIENEAEDLKMDETAIECEGERAMILSGAEPVYFGGAAIVLEH